MGIKGSSTRQVFFNDVKIPVENLLYEREKGFKIAVNILNIGRIKLCGGVMGELKHPSQNLFNMQMSENNLIPYFFFWSHSSKIGRTVY